MLLYRNPKSPDVGGNQVCYCSVTENLKAAAVSVLNAFVWVQAEMDEHTWKDEVLIRYQSRAIAEDRAKTLRGMQFQKLELAEHPEDDTSHLNLLVSNSAWLRCSIGELVASESDVHTLATQIVQSQAGQTISVGKRVQKLVERYLDLFEGHIDVDPLGGYEAEDLTAEVETWGEAVLDRFETIWQFLKLFLSRCSATVPTTQRAPGPVHTVHIVDLSTIQVDGTLLPLNSAKKAALFSLAALGVENIAIEEFARLYNDDLHRHPDRAANFANVTQQALDGLHQSLPHLTVEIPKVKRRTISGVTISSNVPIADLKEWLNSRTAT